MESSREPSQDERRLLEFLIQKATVKFPSNWNANLLVKPLNDEGMGSLLLLPEGVSVDDDRLMGKQVSECQFSDEDGTEVIASLNIDDAGRLFELDIWKTDFSPLIGIPNTLKQFE
ncbi:DUF6984 family protein [Algoriphagus marincola]|uniref:DUF6984 family protein n=1 Tax=Algoriphagus marincola TaxID=264027 RepID=UPI00047DEDEE|nr:hypothetical protein [Algoriphagus marincola]